ncbi:RidA family protein [Aestuariispira insulae]|uniref:Enamine deaminase RidA (YjgF/YER057c/UK114 family) n=1 Tax=Aestuariispira insulae TaxID=1461337 RepID=A0A3D9HK93_9PROT|nr:RidA family protein [Aestuariispira insulae]RED49927.1 enamine deaminase RidA (YjgF/YER057c/UK114 family) [Aestuariispira insulae]
MNPIIPKGLESNYTDWHFSPAVESNGFLFLSGCTGSKPGGGIDDGIEAQTRQAFAKIALSLEAASAGFSDIVEMTSYHVGLQSHLEAFKQVKDEFITEPYPAWTAIGVSELAVPGAIIEIRVIARKTTV